MYHVLHLCSRPGLSCSDYLAITGFIVVAARSAQPGRVRSAQMLIFRAHPRFYASFWRFSRLHYLPRVLPEASQEFTSQRVQSESIAEGRDIMSSVQQCGWKARNDLLFSGSS